MGAAKPARQAIAVSAVSINFFDLIRMSFLLYVSCGHTRATRDEGMRGAACFDGEFAAMPLRSIQRNGFLMAGKKDEVRRGAASLADGLKETDRE